MMGWTIGEWRRAYAEGAAPRKLLAALLEDISADDPIWIAPVTPRELERQVARLGEIPEAQILYGVPLAVKDNIDVEGFPTTAACPEFSYTPQESADVVKRLTDAGAVVIGKTNLDQFATGLVGLRTPYGAVPNPFDSAFIAGGSSSGSAAAVARGLVPLSVGTDTAGSGRVPAGFNNIVGLKPTRGALSMSGVVPACRTLDCVSIFALTVDDAAAVYAIASGFDPADGYSRAAPPAAFERRLPPEPRFGIPAVPEFYGDRASERAWQGALSKLASFGGSFVELDFTSLEEVAALLYDGPWVAERYAAVGAFVEAYPQALHPVVRDIILGAKNYSAADAFDAFYRLADLTRAADAMMASVDALVVPTAPMHPTIAAVEADPVRLNARLGKYTNFVNLLDWSALALPAGFRSDGLPFGVTLIGPAWSERALCAYAAGWQSYAGLARGATGLPMPARDRSISSNSGPHRVQLAVVGAHLSGQPLNRQLTDRSARLVERSRTAGAYRLYALAKTSPPKPGLVRAEPGRSIELEVWEMPLDVFGSFVADIPAPLGIGTIELEDGRNVKGFICESHALDGATDITAFGGWRAYLASLR